MRLLAFKNKFREGLRDLYPEDEIRSFLKLLLQHQLNLSSAESVLQSDLTLESQDLEFLEYAFAELKKQKPIQYILGETEFYGLTLKVNEHTLIPRPETEELVDWIVTTTKHQADDTPINILDIGTGSGCIAIALAKHLPNATAYAIDIAKEALEVAKHNARRNGVHVNFIEDDILQPTGRSAIFQQSIGFDLIVSNPPYVRLLEKAAMQQNVLAYEPHTALFVPDNNVLIFYEHIANLAIAQLTAHGQLFLEINQYLAREVEQLLASKNFESIELKKDIFDNYRMVKANL